MLKRIIIALLMGVIGLCMVFVVVLFTTPCCALQPVVTLESAIQNADGTIHILLSTTIDDIDELRIFDQQGNVIETQSTTFEKQVNTYFWQTTIPGHAQQIRVSTASPLPVGVVVETNVSDWLVRDVPNAIGFVRAVVVRLEPVGWSNPRDDVVRLTTTENVFDRLHLYDATKTLVDSIDTAFVWDATVQQFVWELTLNDPIAYIQLHLRTPIDTMIDVQSVALGWLRQPDDIGFVRGELPMISLVSATARDDGQIEMVFEASELVLESMQLVRNDGTIASTFAVDFVPNDGMRGFMWKVVIPSDAYKLVFVPVSSHQRGVHATSIVATWNEITLGEEIGFIQQP